METQKELEDTEGFDWLSRGGSRGRVQGVHTPPPSLR